MRNDSVTSADQCHLCVTSVAADLKLYIQHDTLILTCFPVYTRMKYNFVTHVNAPSSSCVASPHLSQHAVVETWTETFNTVERVEIINNAMMCSGW